MNPSARTNFESSPLLPSVRTGVKHRPDFQLLNPSERSGWDQMLMQHEDHSFFHGSGWAGVLQSTYGHDPRYLAVLTGSRLEALVPMMEIKTLLVGKRGVSLPFSDDSPILSSPSLPESEVITEAIGFGRKQGWKTLELRGVRHLPGATSPSVSFYGHMLELSNREEQIMSRFASSLRRAVRKAEAARLRVEISDAIESVRIFYLLHCKTRQKHGLPPQPISFFDNIHRSVLSRKMGFVGVAYDGQKPVAAAIFFHLGKRAVFKFGASDPAFLHVRPNNLLLWEAIRWYARNGFASLQFGRTSMGNEGLRRFKLGFGTREYRIDYLKYDFRRNDFVTERDNAIGWYNWLFRLLPIPLSRVIGAVAYGHWA